jgi:hypothetical protein
VSRRLYVLALLTVLSGLLAAVPSQAKAPPAASSEDCRLVVDGPFLYLQADLVIPDSRIECATTQRRIDISSVHTRDGVEVATSSRSCRNQARCDLSIDISSPNIPGDQVWCVTASGSAGRVSFGPATACETDAF